jgi:hypothetical protein
MGKNYIAEKRGDRVTARSGLKSASVWILLFGAMALAIWYLTNDGSIMSMLLMLASVSTITLALLLFFLSPSRYLTSEVAGAMSVSGTVALRKVLAAMHVDSKGVYLPANVSGTTRIWVPVGDKTSPADFEGQEPKPGTEVFILPENGMKGIQLLPPGYGLYEYTLRMGAQYTADAVENEIKDAIGNSLDLADKVSVRREGDRVYITLKNIANHEMCQALRHEDPIICYQTGCPICSAVICMLANGTGKKVAIEQVDAKGKDVALTCRLLGG